jgi:hypothetical protein
MTSKRTTEQLKAMITARKGKDGFKRNVEVIREELRSRGVNA